MSDNMFAKGVCLCGDVKFEISGAPLAGGQCHCKECQRESGH